MSTKTLSFSPLKKTIQLSALFKPILKVLYWRRVSVFLLGILSNTLINAIFDYKYQRALVSVSLEEYINAVFGAWVLLEGARAISRRLDKKVLWQKGILRRLAIQMSIELVFLIVMLNALVIGITYFIYGGFYEIDELVIINLAMISMTLVFSRIDSSIYLYKNRKVIFPSNAESTKEITINVSLGKVKYRLKPSEIRCAVAQSNSVLLITEEKRRIPYSGSLDALIKQLDSEDFFRANRQMVLKKSMIDSIKALDHGKIEVQLAPFPGQPEKVTVSRIKAAEFRRWLNS